MMLNGENVMEVYASDVKHVYELCENYNGTWTVIESWICADGTQHEIKIPASQELLDVIRCVNERN